MHEIPVRRVRKAYEQVADQIRALIVSGAIQPSQRLPNEATLAQDFGVSRATVREALRVLATQNLVHTTKGSRGGSFITLPTVDHVSDFLSANISLLTHAEDVSLDEFLEARDLLEVPAARLAARRHDGGRFDALREAIPERPLELGTQEQFVLNRDFHSELVLASGNPLLCIAAQPIFTVLQTNLQRSVLDASFHARVNEDHRAIAAAVEAADEEEAAERMHDHLVFLRPAYENAWRYAKRARG